MTQTFGIGDRINISKTNYCKKYQSAETMSKRSKSLIIPVNNETWKKVPSQFKQNEIQ